MRTDEIVRYLEGDGQNSAIYIAVNTLDLLKKSGRVTAAGAALGTLMSIKPVLQIRGAKLDAYKRVRGMSAATDIIVNALKNDRETMFAGHNVTIPAAYSGSEAKGEAWRQKLQEAFPDIEVEKDPLSISIACHVGEDALGVGIMRNIL